VHLVGAQLVFGAQRYRARLPFTSYLPYNTLA
jgi:hypothetical protein